MSKSAPSELKRATKLPAGSTAMVPEKPWGLAVSMNCLLPPPMVPKRPALAGHSWPSATADGAEAPGVGRPQPDVEQRRVDAAGGAADDDAVALDDRLLRREGRD